MFSPAEFQTLQGAAKILDDLLDAPARKPAAQPHAAPKERLLSDRNLYGKSFAVGEEVILLSGGHAMTVASVAPAGQCVQLVWHTAEGFLQTSVLSVNVLKHFTEDAVDDDEDDDD